ncbi:DUF6907 domain-containing protein [Streptomyces tsukubensis]
MTGARTVTVPTLDHGPLSLICPSWCAEPHDQAEYRVDITHAGPDTPLTGDTSRGTATILTAWLEQRPYTHRPPGTAPFINIEIGGDCYPCNPAQLHQLAAALTSHATHLRALAGQLTTLLAAEGDA